MDKIETGYELIDNIRIHYAKRGSGARYVLCLPGGLGCWRTDLLPLLTGLGDDDEFTVVAVDPPGYGFSRPLRRELVPMESFRRDGALAHCLMQRLGLLPYSMVGWSDGGETALLLAHSLRHTNHIDKIVVWGCQSYLTLADVQIYEGIRSIRTTWSKGMQEKLLTWCSVDYAQQVWSALVDQLWKIYNSGGNKLADCLPEIPNETLVLHGIKDPLVVKGHPEFIAANIPNARKRVVFHPEGKHNIHIRYPDWFNATIKKFLLENPTVSKL